MATYVKGDAVANATSYELFEKVGDAYNSLATASEINFEVSAMDFEAGDHVLVVKAHADGYESSEYSNAVTYNVVPNYVSYIGATDFSAAGVRVDMNTSTGQWKETVSGTTTMATELLEVDSTNSVWISECAVVGVQYGSGGFYDADKNLVAPLNYDTFGIDQAANASLKFVTPESPASIADIEAECGATIKYVRFIAWAASNGGHTGTEARIYSEV